MMTRTWFISGCSTGFGRAMAETLLARGDRVVATARDVATLDALIAGHGERALALSLDVTRPDQVQHAVEAAVGRFGQIDALVNNAGIGGLGTIEETSVDVARAMMETNLFGALTLIRAVLPGMRARRSGQIVNIGSVAGLIGFPALGYYCASKFALAGLTEALAQEVRGFGIRVTIADLGPFATAFTQSMQVNMPQIDDYDLAALSQAAGTGTWGAGDSPVEGVKALIDAIDRPDPPLHLLLGAEGRAIVARYDGVRRAERDAFAPA